MENINIETLIKNHRSVRDYKEGVIESNEILDMIRVAQSASTSHFVQAYSVILVTDMGLRKEIATLSGNDHVLNSQQFLIFCADLYRLSKACNLHDKKIKSESTENLLVATIDTALIAQNFALIAESRGYGICYIGGVRNNPLAISDLLKIPEKVFPLFGMTVGIPNCTNEIKPRLPIRAVAHENFYEASIYQESLLEYDKEMKFYYQNRSKNKKLMSWTSAMSDYMSVKNRENMKDLLVKKGFNIN